MTRSEDLLRQAASGGLHELRGRTLLEGGRWSDSLTDVLVSDVQALSQYIAPKLFGTMRFVRCVFSRVSLDGLRCKSSHFLECTFEGVVFGDARVGSLQRTTFESCTFDDVQLSHLIVSDCALTNCSLRGVRSAATQWERCSFERTVGQGDFESVAFLDSRFVDADFSRVVMRNCHIIGSGEGIKLADRQDQFVMSPDRLMRVTGAVAAKLSTGGSQRFRQRAEDYARLKGPLIVDETLWSDLARAERTLVMRSLFELRKDNGATELG